MMNNCNALHLETADVWQSKVLSHPGFVCEFSMGSHQSSNATLLKDGEDLTRPLIGKLVFGDLLLFGHNCIVFFVHLLNVSPSYDIV